MDVIVEAFGQAARLIGSLDHKLVEIVFLSLQISLSAVALATLIGLPIGAGLAVGRFPGRQVHPLHLQMAHLQGSWKNYTHCRN